MELVLARIAELPRPLLDGDVPLSASDLDADLKKLISVLDGMPVQQLNPQFLDRLTLPQNTSSYLYILAASVERGGGLTPDSVLWPHVQEFIQRFCHRQVRWSGHRFRCLLEAIARGANASTDPCPGINLIRQALLQLDPKTSTFGSLHLMFVELCLRKRVYNEAFPILDNAISDIAPYDSDPAERQGSPISAAHVPSSCFITQAEGFTTAVTYHHLLSYYVCGATLYACGKRYDQALSFLRTVMKSETPSAASKIQVEAYKRWILINLLKEGKLPSFPRGANGQASKNIRAMSKPYEALGDAFKSGDVHTLHNEIKAGEKIWADDSCTGLVGMLFAARQLATLSALSNDWGSLPMSKVYELAFLPSTTLQDAYAYVKRLIDTEQLKATLQPPAGDLGNSILRLNQKNDLVKHNGREVDRSQKASAQQAVVEYSARVSLNKRHRRQTTKHFHENVAKARKAEAEGKIGGPGAGNGTEWLGKDEELLDAM